MPQCVNHPHRQATYAIPENFCDVCWEMWATEGYTFVRKEELVEIRKDDLRHTWKQFGVTLDDEIEIQMLKEVEHLTHLEYEGFGGIYRFFSRIFNQVRMFLTRF